jgi:hypothetical protein
MWSGALLRSDWGKRGPALLNVLAATVWTLHLAFFIIHERQSLVEEFLAVTAGEFVVGHSRPPRWRRVTERILDPWSIRFNMGSGHGFCAVVSGFFPEIEVADFARFSRLELA